MKMFFDAETNDAGARVIVATTVSVTWAEIEPLYRAAMTFHSDIARGVMFKKMADARMQDDPDTSGEGPNPLANLGCTAARAACDWLGECRRILINEREGTNVGQGRPIYVRPYDGTAPFDLPLWVGHILLQVACLDYKPEYGEIINKIIDA